MKLARIKNKLTYQKTQPPHCRFIDHHNSMIFCQHWNHPLCMSFTFLHFQQFVTQNMYLISSFSRMNPTLCYYPHKKLREKTKKLLRHWTSVSTLHPHVNLSSVFPAVHQMKFRLCFVFRDRKLVRAAANLKKISGDPHQGRLNKKKKRK